MTDNWWAQDAPAEGDWWAGDDVAQAEPRRVAGLGKRFLQGVKDVSLGAHQLAAHIVPDALYSKERTDALDQYIRDQQAQYAQSAPEGTDWMRMAGNVVAGLPLGLAAPAGSGLAAGLAAGALGGAAGAATQPVTSEDYWGDKAQQTAIGAAIGGPLGAAGGAAAKAISPKVDPNVTALMKEGVTPTPGQILGGRMADTEGKLESVPLLGDMIRNAKRRSVEEMNVAAFNRALSPIGQKASGKVGREGVEEVKQALSKEYKDLLPNLTFHADEQFMRDLRGTINDALSTLPAPQARQFRRIMQDKVFHRMPRGAMTGETMQEVESELKNLIRGYKGDASFDNRQIGAALTDVLSLMRGNLVRSNPKEAGRLARINEGYANYARVRDAAGRIGAEEGMFSPAQLQSAVRGADRSVGKGDFATGGALMQDLSDSAKTVLGHHFPNSGTPDRMFLGGLATGGLGYINPYAAALTGAAMLPYTRLGQKATAALLTKRPKGAKEARAAIEAMIPYLTLGVAPGIEEAYR